MTVLTYKWNVDRYHQAIDAGVFDDQPVELLRGEIIVRTPEREPHAYYSTETADYLRGLLGEQAKIREAKPITLPNDSEPEPDLAIVKPLGKTYLEHHPYPEDIFWVIEFAQTTLTKDMTEKKAVYAEAGIQEYWLVDLRNLQLKVFRYLTDHQYTEELTLATGKVSSLAFPNIQIYVEQLFKL